MLCFAPWAISPALNPPLERSFNINLPSPDSKYIVSLSSPLANLVPPLALFLAPPLACSPCFSSSSCSQMAASHPRKTPPKNGRNDSFHSTDLFFKASKIVALIVFSVALAIAAVYFFPLFVSTCTQTVPQLWIVVKGWLTPSVLFLLMNLVVGTLAVTSGMVKRSNKKNIPEAEDVEGEESEEEEEPYAIASALFRENERPRKSSMKRSQSRQDGKASVSFRSDKAGRGSPPRPRPPPPPPTPPQLGRSKSEQVVPPGNPEFHHLKKTGSFESTSTELRKASSASSGLLYVQKSVETVFASTDEVDQKAEDFIGKFYQQMKLQRLESFMRYKDRIERSHG